MIPEAVVTIAGEDVSCNVLTGVSIAHGRDRPGNQPDPATAQLEMFAPSRAVVDKLQINAVVTIDARFPDATTVRRFVGLITDIDLSWDNVDVAGVRVLCASPVAILNRTFIGDEPWPLEIDGARAARILSVVAAVPYETTFATGHEGWYVVPPMSSVWYSTGIAPGDAPDILLTYGGTAPLPLQIFTRKITGLLPGGKYLITGTVMGRTGGISIWCQPGNHAGETHYGYSWGTISVEATADANGELDPQFWPAAGALPGQSAVIGKVTVTAEHQIPVGVIDPGTLNVLSRDVDRQPCLQLLQELADDAGGLAWHTRSGAICYADNEHRRNTPASITLDCGQILMAPQWSKTTGGLINDTTVAYGVTPEGGEQPTVRAVNAESISEFGRMAVHQGTQLAAEVDAQQKADVTIARTSRPVWDMPAVPLDLANPYIDEAATRTLLNMDMHSLLTVSGLPSQGPATVASLWVEGWEETIDVAGTVGNWYLTLHISDYCRTSAFARWDDIPDTVTWDSVNSAMTWDDAACFGPTPNQGRWNDVPANTRWDTVPDSVNWDSWNDYVGAS